MILDILKFILSLLGVCVVFGLTVFVHELGHFLAARRKGLVVERFAIGFGPKIFSFKHNDVEYMVCWIPFGGYVSLPQMAPMEMVEGKNTSDVKDLPPTSPWAKIVTAFWGPAFSLMLAVLCALLLFGIGKNENVSLKTTTLGFVEPGSPADLAGIRPGDRILKINGVTMTHWSKNGTGGILQAVILSTEKEMRVEVERNGEARSFTLTRVPNTNLEGLRGVGFEDPDCRFMPLIVDKLLGEDSPAARAGLKKGDRIVAVNGQPMFSMAQISDIIRQSQGALVLTVQRDGAPLQISLTPAVDLNSGVRMVGIRWKIDFIERVHVDPITQVRDSLLTMGKTLRALVHRDSGVQLKHMSGPVGIFDVIRRLIVNDFRDLISFCVFFNVNLAVLNLLPLPILDGGHIVFAVVEWIRKRPIHVKVLTALQTSFFIVLIAFMLFVSFHDVLRIKRSNTQSKELEQLEAKRTEPRFAPKDTSNQLSE